MRCLIYLTIFVATLIASDAKANCRVANNEIVCDNSNTFIDTYNALMPKQLPVHPVYVINQPIELPAINNNYQQFDFKLLDFNAVHNFGEKK